MRTRYARGIPPPGKENTIPFTACLHAFHTKAGFQLSIRLSAFNRRTTSQPRSILSGSLTCNWSMVFVGMSRIAPARGTSDINLSHYHWLGGRVSSPVPLAPFRILGLNPVHALPLLFLG